jgi:hypothetical protein
MSESLSKRISEFVRATPARQRGLTRAAVIALRDDIQKALDDGWSVMDIWRTLHAEDSIKIGYHSFRRHVAGGVVAKREKQRKDEPRAAPSSMSRDATVTNAPDTRRGFQHERLPQKKEIYG